MKKATLVFAALLAIAAVPAFAQSVGFDNYHYNANMNCSDCHSMHASAHNNLTDGSAITTPNTTPGTAINPYYVAPASGEGRHYLLKNDDVCATCHDGKTWAPDVIGDNTNESDENFYVDISNADGATISTASDSAVINDDD